jgi:hypothetical protein
MQTRGLYVTSDMERSIEHKFYIGSISFNNGNMEGFIELSRRIHHFLNMNLYFSRSVLVIERYGFLC